MFIRRWLDEDESRSLGQLATKSGLSKGYLSRLARGERSGFRPDTVGPLSQALGIPVEHLIEASGATIVRMPSETFREFVTDDRRLSTRQRDGLLHMYYELFGIRDDSPA